MSCPLAVNFVIQSSKFVSFNYDILASNVHCPRQPLDKLITQLVNNLNWSGEQLLKRVVCNWFVPNAIGQHKQSDIRFLQTCYQQTSNFPKHVLLLADINLDSSLAHLYCKFLSIFRTAETARHFYEACVVRAICARILYINSR